MKKIFALIIVAVFSITMFTGCGSKSESIVVGAKDFTEQDILGNMLTILIRENTDVAVEYKNEMSSNVVFEAITNGEIDIYIDYTGTIYGSYLKHSEAKTSEEIYDISVSELAERYNLRVLKPLGFNNTYTLSVRRDTAEEYGVATISDLAEVSDQMILGATFEVLNRDDGIPNLKETYNMSFLEETAIDGTMRYTALENNEVQVIDAFSTDAMLLEYNLVVLEDDLSYFPPYYAVPVISEETAEKYPEIATQLDRLIGILDDDTMRDLNYQVDVLAMNPSDVAEEFLQANGLI